MKKYDEFINEGFRDLFIKVSEPTETDKFAKRMYEIFFNMLMEDEFLEKRFNDKGSAKVRWHEGGFGKEGDSVDEIEFRFSFNWENEEFYYAKKFLDLVEEKFAYFKNSLEINTTGLVSSGDGHISFIMKEEDFEKNYVRSLLGANKYNI